MSVSKEVLQRYADSIGDIREMAIELLALREANRWTPGKPPDCGDADWQDIARFHGTMWTSNFSGRKYMSEERVTHYLALPAPPEAT